MQASWLPWAPRDWLGISLVAMGVVLLALKR